MRRLISMDNQWEQLSPEEKREKRFQKWLNPEGTTFVSPVAEIAYKQRVQRLIDAYSIRKPDRVPVVVRTGSIPAYQYGLNYKTVSYDYEKSAEAFGRFNEEHAVDLDSYAVPFAIAPGKVLDILDYKLYNWPGHGLPDDSRGYQYIEEEYMKVDEYDAFLKDPSDFWLRTYLPRVFGVLDPFRTIKPLTHIIELPMTDFSVLARPDVQSALQALIDAGKEYGQYSQMAVEFSRKMLSSGYPATMGGYCKAPFDTLGDTLRGTKAVLMDMYRRPDKVLEAVDKITDLTISTTIASASASSCPVVTFPLHKGADGWMNQKQFEKFYWPSLKKVVNALINEGFMVQLFAEGSYNSRLDSVNEFPKGSIIWWFDQTDISKAKAILGDTCCICGNLPSSLLVTGSPQQVKEACRNLIDVAGKGGGYILSPGAMADEAKLDNLKAMVEAAKEFGVYQ
jgi:uroporphyrinogen-III decarboxylase